MIESVAASKALQSLKEMNLDKEDLTTIVPHLTIVVDELIAKVSMNDDIWALAAETKANLQRRNVISREILARASAKQFCQKLSIPPEQDSF